MSSAVVQDSVRIAMAKAFASEAGKPRLDGSSVNSRSSAISRTLARAIGSNRHCGQVQSFADIRMQATASRSRLVGVN